MIEEEDNPEDLFLNVLDNNLDINKKDRVRKKLESFDRRIQNFTRIDL